MITNNFLLSRKRIMIDIKLLREQFLLVKSEIVIILIQIKEKIVSFDKFYFRF